MECSLLLIFDVNVEHNVNQAEPILFAKTKLSCHSLTCRDNEA